jgi:hypothetical protein
MVERRNKIKPNSLWLQPSRRSVILAVRVYLRVNQDPRATKVFCYRRRRKTATWLSTICGPDISLTARSVDTKLFRQSAIRPFVILHIATSEETFIA